MFGRGRGELIPPPEHFQDQLVADTPTSTDPVLVWRSRGRTRPAPTTPEMTIPTTQQLGQGARHAAFAVAPAVALGIATCITAAAWCRASIGFTYQAGLISGRLLHQLNDQLAAAWAGLIAPPAPAPAAAQPAPAAAQPAPASAEPVAAALAAADRQHQLHSLVASLPQQPLPPLRQALPVAVPAPLPAGTTIAVVPAAAPAGLEQLTYRQARRRCHQLGIAPGRSRASALAALAAAGA